MASEAARRSRSSVFRPVVGWPVRRERSWSSLDIRLEGLLRYLRRAEVRSSS